MHLSKMNKASHRKNPSNKKEMMDKMEHMLAEYGDELMELGIEKVKKQMWICMHEAMNGPHFDEETAYEAVEEMKNEDGSTGPKFSFRQAEMLAEQHDIDLEDEDKFNEWDWFVALNMVYSDYCEVVKKISGQMDPMAFVCLAKAWLCDKDISEGKMWHYYVYIMCDDEDEKDMHKMHRMGSMHRMSRRGRNSRGQYTSRRMSGGSSSDYRSGSSSSNYRGMMDYDNDRRMDNMYDMEDSQGMTQYDHRGMYDNYGMMSDERRGRRRGRR